MMPAHALLDINTGFAREVFDQDRHGTPIRPEKSTTACVYVESTLRCEGGSLAIRTVVRVPKDAASTSEARDAMAVRYLTEELPARLTSSSYLNFFELTWLTAKLFAPATTAELRPADIPLTLSERITEQAEAALAHIAAVRIQFDAARTRLNDIAFHHTAFGFSQVVNDGRAVLRRLADVLEASADMGGYQARDARAAVNDLEELARRKVEANRNYQAHLQDLQRFAFGVTFPRSWHRRPPLAG